MEKKLLSAIGAIVAFAGIVIAAYFIIERLLRKSKCCCEDVEFDNYVECPCVDDDDDFEDSILEETAEKVKEKFEDVKEVVSEKLEDVKEAVSEKFEDLQ